MNLNTIVASISVAVTFAALAAYLRSVSAGFARPHSFSWLVWACTSSIAYSAQVVGDAGPGAWSTFAGIVTYVVVFLVSLSPKGEHNIAPMDWISLGSATVALVMWMVTDNPLISVVLIVAVDFFGFLPTIRKSLLNPAQESSSYFFLAGLRALISLWVLKDYSIITWLYPVSVLTQNFAFAWVIRIPNRSSSDESFAIQSDSFA